MVAGGRSGHPLLSGGASMQLSLSHFRVDYYPYHRALGDRLHWIRSVPLHFSLDYCPYHQALGDHLNWQSPRWCKRLTL